MAGTTQQNLFHTARQIFPGLFNRLKYLVSIVIGYTITDHRGPRRDIK